MTKESFKKASAGLDQQLLEEVQREKPDLNKMAALVSAGADVNGRDNGGLTALMNAVSKHNKDAVEFLIDNGADMYARNGEKNQANAMMYALAHYDLNMVRMFLDKKFDPNRGPVHGTMTALMWAANLGKLDLCEELARRGADINAKNPRNGWTAMDYARNNLKPHIADRLLEIDALNRTIAAHEEAEKKQRLLNAQVAAQKAEFDAMCDAGLPVRHDVTLMYPLTLKPRPKR